MNLTSSREGALLRDCAYQEKIHLDEDLDDVPVFIVGPPRCGTTLLTQMLSRHSGLFIFNESLFYDMVVANDLRGLLNQEERNTVVQHLFSRLDARLSRVREGQEEFGCRFDKQDIELIKERFLSALELSAERVDYVFLLKEFMKVVVSVKKAKRWGDKTPSHVFHLEQIQLDYPGSKFVNVIRAPDDFLLSYKYAWRQKGGRLVTSKLYHPLITTMIWLRSVKVTEEFCENHGQEACLTIRYEDLLESMEPTLRQVCNFIGEAFDSAMMAVQGSNTSFNTGEKERLLRWERAVSTALTSKYASRYGYVSDESRAYEMFAILRSFVTLPWFLVGALPVVMNFFRGGLIRYLRARALIPKARPEKRDVIERIRG